VGRLLNQARKRASRRKTIAVKPVEPVSTLRPDQLLKQKRDAAAEKQARQDANRTTPFAPIKLLPERKPGDPANVRRSCYCGTCLRKYRFNVGQKPTKCLDCCTDLIKAKSRTAMNRIVRKLKKGLRIRRSDKPKKDKGGYDVYLRSPLWRRIRKRIFERDGYLCRDCGIVAEHVHHLSYGPLVMMGKDDSKLISLCVPCHDSRHPDKPSMVKKKAHYA